MDLENQQTLLLPHSQITAQAQHSPPTTTTTTTPPPLWPTCLSRLISSHGDFDRDDVQLIPECPYPRPFVILDLIWNLAFVLVAAFVLLTTINERPSTPLRLWIAGYALQCLLHVSFVWVEHQRTIFTILNFMMPSFHFPFCVTTSFIKRLESINTVISSIWWVFGFYWIYMGGQALLQDSPRLYWLSVVFLAFDVFFMIFCVAMTCLVFVLLVCCFPLLARIAYAMTIGDGASENDIRTLPKYRYCQANTTAGTFGSCKKQEEAGLVAHLGSNSDIPAELALSFEDSECCICLHSYEDGEELCTLPCNHHFHYRCIRKWLRINATCPLCKFNILRGETLV